MYVTTENNHKKDNDLSNILERNCHLRMLEIVFQSIKISKLSDEHALLKTP